MVAQPEIDSIASSNSEAQKLEGKKYVVVVDNVPLWREHIAALVMEGLSCSINHDRGVC